MTMLAASHISIPGLRNIGNTCYAAAVLQVRTVQSALAAWEDSWGRLFITGPGPHQEELARQAAHRSQQ